MDDALAGPPSSQPPPLLQLHLRADDAAHERIRERGVERGRCFSEPRFAEQVRDRGGPHHFRRAERQIADRAHHLFELAREAGDLGGVERVVRPRGQLVHEERPVFEQKHLHDEQPFGDRRLTRFDAEDKGLGRASTVQAWVDPDSGCPERIEVRGRFVFVIQLQIATDYRRDDQGRCLPGQISGDLAVDALGRGFKMGFGVNTLSWAARPTAPAR